MNENLSNFTNYSMFSVDDYSLLQTGLLENRGSSGYSIRISLTSGTSQPTQFILRIFNQETNEIFRDPFTITLGNSGVYFGLNDQTFFIFSRDYEVPNLSASSVVVSSPEEEIQPPLGYKRLFFIFFYSFFAVLFLLTLKWK